MRKRLLLRPTLFWDAEFEKLGVESSAQFIIGRVLDFGNLKDWQAMKDFYGLAKIRKAAQRHIFSDPRGANFWSIMLDIPLRKLKCTRNLSLKTPKAFLMR